jgi:glutaredoxin-related protein
VAKYVALLTIELALLPSFQGLSNNTAVTEAHRLGVPYAPVYISVSLKQRFSNFLQLRGTKGQYDTQVDPSPVITFSLAVMKMQFFFSK